MGRAPKDDKMGLRKGSWSAEEDQLLINFIHRYGHNNWLALPKQAGLLRCGKSCRLRWNNYLRPDIKRGNFTSEEKQAIIILHQVLGNRWSAIASHLPGRTGNEIKNVWRSHLQKEIRRMAIDPVRNTVAMHLSWRTAPNSFTSLDKSEYSHVSVEGIPSMKKDELADNLVLCQTEASVDSPTTFSNLSDSFYQSYNLSSEIPSYSEAASGILGSKFDWLQSNLINSFDVALGYDQQPPTIEDDTKLEDLLIDNTLIFENQNFEDEERSLPRQSENATAITASELVFEHSLNVKAHKFMFAYPEYDCLSSIDIADTNPHQLWNIDMEDYSDGVDYWLNVLRQDGPSPTTTTTPGISN